MAIGDDLRKAIRVSGLSNSEISRRAGVPRPCVSRFMANGDSSGGVSLATVEKLTSFFSLKLVLNGSIPKPDPKPVTIFARISALLAKHPDGLVTKQITDRLGGLDCTSLAIRNELYRMKKMGAVRYVKRTGAYKLVKKSRQELSRGLQLPARLTVELPKNSVTV